MSQQMDEVTDLRLKLLANGYSPIQNFDKQTFLKGWPSLEITQALITSPEWRRASRFAATGLRLENGLAVIDLDLNLTNKMFERMVKQLMDAIPALGQACMRQGSGNKEAWFVRTSEPFGRIASADFLLGDDVKDGIARCEIFGGASARQFGSFGPHTRLEDGSTKIAYQWVDDTTPQNVPLSELPLLDRSDFECVAQVVSEFMWAEGYESHLQSKAVSENTTAVVYDLDDEMIFEISDEWHIDLDGLREYAADGDLRCSASWLEGDGYVGSYTRCLISLTDEGNVRIWESAAGVTHLEASTDPEAHRDAARTTINGATLVEAALASSGVWPVSEQVAEPPVARLASGGSGRLLRPVEGDGIRAAAETLRRAYAIAPQIKAGGVVPLDARSPDEVITITDLKMRYAPWSTEAVRGTPAISAVGMMLRDPDRLEVRGISMRADLPSGLFDDRYGWNYINTYYPPEHDAEGGSAKVFIELVDHLFPAQDEKDYFWQWLAYKIQNPSVPSTAIIMVAQGTYGTGRGTLFKLLAKLLGQKYATDVEFKVLTGKSGQSAFQDFAIDKLLVTVDESFDGEKGNSYTSRKAAYEALKGLVAPDARMKRLRRKGLGDVDVLMQVSYLIATNHGDAIPVPTSDRRFAVLANGEPLTQAQARYFNNAVRNDADVAELYRILMNMNVALFDPYTAPEMTAAKAAMIDSSKSDIDHGFEYAVGHLKDRPFSIRQVTSLMRAYRDQYDDIAYGVGNDEDGWQRTVRRMVPDQCIRIGIRNGSNWHLRIGDKKTALYTTSKQKARDFTLIEPENLKALVSEGPSTTDAGQFLKDAVGLVLHKGGKDDAL